MKEVILLSASDIFKGSINGPNDTHCLIGWRNLVFNRGYQCSHDATIAIRQAIKEACPNSTSDDIIMFNDGKATRSLIARVWNRAMYLIGFTEGNKENKPIKPIKPIKPRRRRRS